jgi:Uma2 family endonuclease
MAITQTELTIEEFLKLPEEEPALEYAGGRVTQKMSPKARHGRLEYCLARLFGDFAEPPRLAVVFIETRFTFGAASFVPDVAVVRWNRVPRDAEGWPEDDLMLAPDIAVEIASPGQTRADLIERCRWFVENDVGISLLVEPRDRSVSRVQRGEDPRVLRGDDRIDLDSVLPGFELTPRELFDSLRLD